jgi:hypothetical protein
MFAALKEMFLTAHVIRRGLVSTIKYVAHLSLICHTQTLYPRRFCIS